MDMETYEKVRREMRDAPTDEEREKIRKFHCDDRSLWSTLTETFWGILFCIFCGLLLACVYVGGVGYGVGSFFYYSFVTTCHMPFDFHTMYQCAMIPFLNIFLFVIAVWIVAIKFAFIAICWIAVTFFSWVPTWVMKIIGK